MNFTMLQVPETYQKLYRQAMAGKTKAAIRCHCLMCVGWEKNEVEACTATACPLYPMRNRKAQAATEAPKRERSRQKALQSGVGDRLRKKPVATEVGETDQNADANVPNGQNLE